MVQDEAEGEDGKGKELVHLAEPTLLPAPVAGMVSFVTRSSSLYLQLGTYIGKLAISGARITTLTGLEVSRALIEGILHRAGKDVANRSIGEIGRAEADTMLERSISTLHSTITGISFAASTGFHLSSTILSTAGDFSQHLLVVLDSILGSTDSSRAIASIITLIRREFQNPATGQEGEKVGVGDLLVGICGLALLQRWCKKITDAESKDKRYEEVVWDVVILDDGRRVDVISDGDETKHKAITRTNSMSFVTPGGDEVVQTIEREARLREDSDDDLPEINLKQKIMRSLPPNASVSITTETTTTKTITVEIKGAEAPDLSPPPGVEMIEENAHHIKASADSSGDQQMSPSYRVVYRVAHHKLRGTNIESKSLIEGTEEAIEVSDEEEKPDAPPKTPRTSPDPVVSPIPTPETRPDPPPKSIRNISKAASIKSVSSSQSTESAEHKPMGFSAIPVLASKSPENTANQKRSRKPMSSASSINGSEPPPPQKKATMTKPPPAKKAKSERPTTKTSEKKGSFRNALRRGSSSALSHMWNKESSPDGSTSKAAPSKPVWGVPNPNAVTKSQLPVPQRSSSIDPLREAPRPPQRGNPNYFSSRDLGLVQPADVQRSSSRTSYYSIHERRRDSLVSQTDTYSIHSAETRPGSPTTFRTHLKAQSNLLRARSEKSIANSQPTSSPKHHHRRSKSYVPSIYTLKTNNSEHSLVLAKPKRSAYEDSQTMENLASTGLIDGLFPNHHIVRNISRFVRFASASYGSHFLRVMGISSPKSPAGREFDTDHHHEHHSFSTHTQLPADTILLSSFVDPQGGTDSTGNTNTGVPMVHFVSLDHESKAVVLTCRGTLGFEDVLTDMTCDYDELTYRGKAYKVHKGIHASARRLLDGGGGRVMATIAASLEEFPDYGLVLCGHSLGGGVTALLAILISEPSSDPTSTAFFTASNQSPQLLLTSSSEGQGTAPLNIRLPPGRPIHVYAYGPPATVSPSLRLATRGLITTTVNGQDLVPFLSLGVLHDLQAIALAFKTDDSGAKGEFRKRVVAGITDTFADRWYANRPSGINEEDDQWAHSALKVLRASMLSVKLSPPGEVFIVETMPVLQRDAFVRHDDGYGKEGKGLGRPATRSVLKYVRDVEKRFGEVRFGGSMLLDHSPGRYEGSLGALARGVLS